MIDVTRTTTDLLNGLAGERHTGSWEEFDRRYRPILVNIARRMGVSNEDASDVAQDTLMRFLVAYREGKYDRERGRLRAWLIGIARYRIMEARRARAKEAGYRGESVVNVIEDDQEINEAWDAEQRNHLLRIAFEKLRSNTKMNEQTIRAFEMLTHQQLAAPDVAEALGMEIQDVYVAKSRCLKKIREIIDELERTYDEFDE
ncbi:MAG: sigma-70 family RNA polymerase sigma factor [Phycisphaerales bacterium]